ncbi:MAG: hypothetical protein JGK35_19330 [Microcoleus sp. PH2017_16_JOR_D_A]|uniref:hypothetical protein n=1 Tax=Microcoleus sp. PH2017_16_JOR_D_A TaxID=2798827 RepID=UPI001DB454A7|nr:hypothetical protein [Microcoleus sp. PH2017_16_JOR_D_A]MCC3492638.1 hypothetical protein [Microcoleus sp. PH2017_16_JOR_D_A]
MFQRSQVRSTPVRWDDTRMRSLMRCDDREHLLLCSIASAVMLDRICCYDRELLSSHYRKHIIIRMPVETIFIARKSATYKKNGALTSL